MKALAALPADFQAILSAIPAILATPIPSVVSARPGQPYPITMSTMPPNLPPMPARPADPRLAALYDHLVVPLYTIAVKFQQDVTAAITATQALPSGAPPLAQTTGLVLTPSGFVSGPAGGATTPFEPGSAADGQYQALIASGYSPADAYAIAATTQASITNISTP